MTRLRLHLLRWDNNNKANDLQILGKASLRTDIEIDTIILQVNSYMRIRFHNINKMMD